VVGPYELEILRDGRDFEEQDRNRKVAIVSASLAQRLWGSENPVGRKLEDNGQALEVVGITPDFRSTNLEREPVNMLYIPYWQRPRLGASLLVRTAMDPRSIANALTVEFADGRKLKEIVIEYPIGHKRRRKEGMPLLVEKFKTNLARRFPAKQQNAILELCADPKKLAATPVNEFVDMMVI
jgi:hypothetical protein